MKFIIKILFVLLLLQITTQIIYCQQPGTGQKTPTKEEVLNMSYEQLLNLPFDQLINLANIVGVSAEELLQMILNKEVSSASKSKETVFQSPLSTTVISKEEIISSGATSIADALRMVPGMVIREKTPGNYDLHIRGNDNIPPKNMFIYSEDAMSLIMIDNRPVYNYSFGGTFWETLPIDVNDVERIEVIRGPSSALYGPNAVAGVVNIITKHPDSNKISVNANVQMGNNYSKIYNAGISGGFGSKFKYRVSGNYEGLDRFQHDFYVFDLNQRLSWNQMDTLTSYWDPMAPRKPLKADENFGKAIPNDKLATNKYGTNIFLFYDLNKDVTIDLSAGLQQSEIVSTSLGNHSIPYTGRTSSTQYFDLRSKAYGFEFQANYMFGNQEINRGNPAWHIDPHIFNSQLEYERKFGNLVLRPGIGFQQTVYSDKKYIDVEKKDGFLNGDKELHAIAGYLRADYKPFEKLRLIAALRGDKYNIPNKTYFTYQFITTFTLNENNLIRGVYSRANRGPFIVDSHADYNWVIVPGNPYSATPSNYYTLHWEGNSNLKLPVTEMFEIGYRTKPIKNIMVDIEAFRTVTKDFSYFMPDSMYLYANISPMATGKPPSVTGFNGSVRYYNFDLKSVQIGITCNISVAISKKLNFRLFGTLQETKLYDFYPKTIWSDFQNLIGQDIALLTADANKIGGQLMTGDFSALATPNRKYSTANVIDKSELDTIYHKATPAFTGGFSIDFTPTEKLSAFATLYYYTEQTILHNKIDYVDANGASDMYHVQPKAILNLKVSYKVWKENSIFINARNLLNDSKREFAYTDKISGLYLVGVTLNF